MKIKVQIEGMSCSHCVAHVKEALEEISTITSVEVSLEGKYAVVEGEVTEEVIRDAIDEAGYDVTHISKMTE